MTLRLFVEKLFGKYLDLDCHFPPAIPTHEKLLLGVNQQHYRLGLSHKKRWSQRETADGQHDIFLKPALPLSLSNESIKHEDWVYVWKNWTHIAKFLLLQLPVYSLKLVAMSTFLHTIWTLPPMMYRYWDNKQTLCKLTVKDQFYFTRKIHMAISNVPSIITSLNFFRYSCGHHWWWSTFVHNFAFLALFVIFSYKICRCFLSSRLHYVNYVLGNGHWLARLSKCVM